MKGTAFLLCSHCRPSSPRGSPQLASRAAEAIAAAEAVLADPEATEEARAEAAMVKLNHAR